MSPAIYTSLLDAPEKAQQDAANSATALHAELEAAAKKEKWLSLTETSRQIMMLEERFEDIVQRILSMAPSTMAADDEIRCLAIQAAMLKSTIEQLRKV